MMNHQDIKDRLNDHLDGALSEGERAEVSQHLESCTDCSLEFAQLQTLLGRTEDLPPSIEPPRDLWREIERQIQPATVVASPSPNASFFVRFRQWIFIGVLGAAATAAAFLLIPTEDPTGNQNVASQDAESPGNLALSDPGYISSLVRAFESQCMGAGKQLLASAHENENPFVTAAATAFEADVQQLDLAISETRAALEENPQDTLLLRMLMSSYQRKLSVLHRATRYVQEA